MIRSISIVILKGPPHGKLCHSDTFYAPTRFSDSFTTVRARACRQVGWTCGLGSLCWRVILCCSDGGVEGRARGVVGPGGERQPCASPGDGPPAGQQPGSPGFTLSQVPDPDEVVTHRPVRCRACDRTLSDLGVVGTTVRQVFDVLDPTVIVTEHRAEQRRFIPRSCTRSPRANGSVASSRYGRAGSRPRRVLSCKRNPG